MTREPTATGQVSSNLYQSNSASAPNNFKVLMSNTEERIKEHSPLHSRRLQPMGTAGPSIPSKRSNNRTIISLQSLGRNLDVGCDVENDEYNLRY